MSRSAYLPNYNHIQGARGQLYHALDAEGYIVCRAGRRTTDIFEGSRHFEDCDNRCWRCVKELRRQAAAEPDV